MRKITLILGILFSLTAPVSAQISVFAEDDNAPFMPETELFRPATTPKTLAFSLSQPFLDDFAQAGQLPDSNLWYMDGANRTPLKYHRGAINPPTEGVLTFDGLNMLGKPYSTIFSSGLTDRLESHYIDLSQVSPGDSVYLSLFMQPKGQGDVPESGDSLQILFRDNNQDWIRMRRFQVIDPIFSTQAFTMIMVPVRSSMFMHDKFQIRIQTYGSRNFHIDLWHIDYVYLAAGRTITDSTIFDAAITDVFPSPTLPYTALNYQEFVGKNLQKNLQVGVSNLSGSLTNVFVSANLSDPVGNNNLSGTTNLQASSALSARSSQFLTTASAFSDQNLQALNASYYYDYTLTSIQDLIPRNNQYRELFRVDSLLAYDDGEAEGSYGITAARGFGQQYSLSKPDYLEAVWICFSPRVHYNVSTQQSTYMENRDFRLNVWNKAHPDSLLVEQDNMKIFYGDSLHTFVRYPLAPAVLVEGTFWVGVGQKDDKPVGVGWDVNDSLRNLIYWDNAGSWEPSTIKGALMIRPEFRNKDYAAPVGIAPNALQSQVKIFPNPLHTQHLNVKLPADLQAYTLTLWDNCGRKIAEETRPNPETQQAFVLPVLAPGIYQLRHQFTDGKGRQVVETDRLVVE